MKRVRTFAVSTLENFVIRHARCVIYTSRNRDSRLHYVVPGKVLPPQVDGPPDFRFVQRTETLAEPGLSFESNEAIEIK